MNYTSNYTGDEIDELLTKSNFNTPIGTIISFMGTKAPTGYLACDGSLLNISDCPTLANFFEDQFEAINYFGGDGVTTFALPNLCGEFLRGSGQNSHQNQGNGAAVGVHQDGTTHPNIWVSGTPDIAFAIANTGESTFAGCGNQDHDNKYAGAGHGKFIPNTYMSNWSGSDPSTRTYSSRPTNTSVLYCIKYI